MDCNDPFFKRLAEPQYWQDIRLKCALYTARLNPQSVLLVKKWWLKSCPAWDKAVMREKAETAVLPVMAVRLGRDLAVLLQNHHERHWGSSSYLEIPNPYVVITFQGFSALLRFGKKRWFELRNTCDPSNAENAFPNIEEIGKSWMNNFQNLQAPR